jgi:hypothetical protein
MGSGDEERKRERRRGGETRPLGLGLGPDVEVAASAAWKWMSGGGGEHGLANATSSPASSAAVANGEVFFGLMGWRGVAESRRKEISF